MRKDRKLPQDVSIWQKDDQLDSVKNMKWCWRSAQKVREYTVGNDIKWILRKVCLFKGSTTGVRWLEMHKKLFTSQLIASEESNSKSISGISWPQLVCFCHFITGYDNTIDIFIWILRILAFALFCWGQNDLWSYSSLDHKTLQRFNLGVQNKCKWGTEIRCVGRTRSLNSGVRSWGA